MSQIDVGHLAAHVAQGYYPHVAALSLAADPRALGVLPDVEPGQVVPTGWVPRKDGSSHAFHLAHYIAVSQSEHKLAEELRRVWLTGALLTLGQRLADGKYFGHGPIVEMVYHLRNAVAHGNHFCFNEDGRKRLRRYPAHTRQATYKGDSRAVFEVTEAPDGQEVLFNYMEAGDVLDVLFSVRDHLHSSLTGP